MSDIQQELNKVLQAATIKCDDFPWDQEEAYCDWLAQSYYFVCHSTRLLGAAAARFKIDRNKLHIRFGDHIREERSHEVLAERDLRHFGKKPTDYTELPITAAFYQSQYYLVEHEDPIALMGYILFLEALAVKKGPDLMSRARAAFGEGAISYLKVHAEEDDDHLDSALKQLESLTDRELGLVLQSMVQTASLYVQMLEIVKERTGYQASSKSLGSEAIASSM